MRIFIYTCSFGAGHMQAAKFIQGQLFPVYETKIIDVPHSMFPGLSPVIYKSYGNCIKRHRVMYHLYLQADRRKVDLLSKLTLLEQKFFRWMDGQELPDVFIATHSFAAYFLSRYKEARGLKTPLVTCITDFTPHELWINPDTAVYLVASDYTRKKLEEEGIPEKRILIFGLSEKQVQILSRKRGKALHVLVTGGGLGLLPENTDFYYRLRKNYVDEIRVICGNNRSLYRKLKREAIPGIRVFGFVDNMTQQWAWADIVVGKAGGLSTFEAIQSETPIFYLPPYLPQEKRNAEFIQKTGIGHLLRSEDLPSGEEPRQLLYSYSRHMHEMKEDLSPEDFLHWLNVQEA